MKRSERFSGGVVRALSMVLACVLGVTAGAAQEVTGSISGTVTDPSGAAIKGATVTLINTDRNATVRTVPTNAAGFYTATSLPLGGVPGLKCASG